MKKITGLRRLEDTVIRVTSHGDNWHMTWADDDKQYVSLCDGKGFPDMPQGGEQGFNSRAYAIVGDPPNMKFEYLPGYPELLSVWNTRECSRYYNFGILEVDGTIYQFLNTPNVPFYEPHPRFVGAKLIYSRDHGKTWHNQDGSTPVVWEPWDQRSHDNMIFFFEPSDAFCLVTMLQMGKHYSDNTDGYAYLYSPNGNTEGTMNQTVMARVPKNKILQRAAYEFFAGMLPDGDAKWTKRIEDRAVMYQFASGWVNRLIHPYAWHPCVTYYAPTKQYLMANWGMGTDATEQWFTKPSYLGFWTSPTPWGPWTQVHEETAWTPDNDQAARAYQPQIAPKWISPDGKSFWLVWTDFQPAVGHPSYYAFNLQKVEVTLVSATANTDEKTGAIAAQYERDGWVSVARLIPRELIDRVRVRIDAIMRGEYETGRAPNARNWNPGDSELILRKIDQANISDRTILEMILHPALGQMAAALSGARRVQVFGVQLLYKPPGGQATSSVGWHQDHQYWHDTYIDGGTLTAWIAISDVTEASGPMKVVLGSHQWGLRSGGDFFSGKLEEQKSVMAAQGREWREASAILSPGDVSFHHHLTIHGSGPNVSDRPRIGFAVHLMTDRSRFPSNRPAYFVEQLNDSIACPVIYDVTEGARQ